VCVCVCVCVCACVCVRVWIITHSRVTWLSHMHHDSIIFVKRLNHLMRRLTTVISFTCDMSHSHVTCHIHIHMWHVTFTFDMSHSRVTCLIRMWHVSFTRDMSHSHVPWLIHVSAMTQSHDEQTPVSHLCKCHDSITDMSHSCKYHDSSTWRADSQRALIQKSRPIKDIKRDL